MELKRLKPTPLTIESITRLGFTHVIDNVYTTRKYYLDFSENGVAILYFDDAEHSILPITDADMLHIILLNYDVIATSRVNQQ